VHTCALPISLAGVNSNVVAPPPDVSRDKMQSATAELLSAAAVCILSRETSGGGATTLLLTPASACSLSRETCGGGATTELFTLMVVGILSRETSGGGGTGTA